MLRLFKYLIDWGCPYKQRFWLEVISTDVPVLGFDIGLIVWWDHLLIALGSIPHGVGPVIQYAVGLSAVWLTIVRIKHFNKLMKQMDSKKDV